jgi:CubicO group peptidase (beta-lactamase class C family)
MNRAPASAEELFNTICELIPNAMTRHQIPGAALGITCEGRDFIRGFGVTSVDHPLPVDEDTLFQIGSTTKTFTATAVMRLVEAGKLALDAPIRTYLPDFSMRDPAVTEGATMRHLMTHTGGWVGDFFPDTGNGDDALAKYVHLMAQLPQLTPAGMVWSYNNAGFSLAGRVIEAVTGETYEAALSELILKPLGLKRSFLFPTQVMLHSFAVGHMTVEGKPHVLRPWQLPRALAAAGEITASMKDQLRYARFHLGDGAAEDGTRILSRESMVSMQTPAVPATGDIKMGIAWRTRDIGGIRRVFHGGSAFGQISFFTMTPRRKFGLALTTNSMSGAMLARDVTRDLLPKFLGNEEPEPAEVAMTPAQLSEYAARYTAAMDDLEVRLVDGKLMLQPRLKGGFPTIDTPPGPQPPPFRIGFIARDRIAMVDPPMKDVEGEFLRAADGSIAWLRWGGRIHARECELDFAQKRGYARN